MEHDGTKAGFAIDLLAAMGEQVSIPIIASGGAGNAAHFVEVFERTTATGALAASIFHFGEVAIPDLKAHLRTHHITVR
jgi:cyclase